MRVLYVEDAVFLAEAVKHNLEKQGISVDLSNDGEDGLGKALDDIYDCVVLDIMLPKMSGTDILKRMRGKRLKLQLSCFQHCQKLRLKLAI